MKLAEHSENTGPSTLTFEEREFAAPRRPQPLPLLAGVAAALAVPLLWWLWPQLGAPVQRLVAVVLAGIGVVALAVAWRQRRRLQRLRHHLEQSTTAPTPAVGNGAAAADGQSPTEALLTVGQALRSPMLQLSGQLAVLMEDGSSAAQGEALKAAAESTERVQQLLADLIEIGQLVSGRWPLRPGRVSPRSVLNDVEAQARGLAARRGVLLQADSDPAVPAWVMLDAARVRQLLMHVVGHAIRAQGRGQVALELRDEGSGQGGSLWFQVRAAGLAPVLPRGLFGHGPLDEARRGAGLPLSAPALALAGDGGDSADADLGLRLASDLAQALGGTLSAHALPAGGALWRLELPRVLASAPAATAAPPAASGPQNLSVLVAEDHEVNRLYIGALLDSLGHRATFAADGRQAVAAAGSGSFDLVLMDLHMPELDGLQATRELRGLADSARASVPIVALTADAALEARDQCLLAGMNDFLAKPIGAEALQACLRRLFGSEARGEAADGAWHPLPLPWVAGSFLLDTGVINATLQSVPRERLAAMLASFFDDGPAALARLHGAVREGQPESLRVSAQALRGAALNLGLVALAGTAEALHEGAQHLPAHEIALLIKRLEDQLRGSRQALEAAGLMQV